MGRYMRFCAVRLRVLEKAVVKVLFQYVPDPVIGNGIGINGAPAGIVKPLGTILAVKLDNAHCPFVGRFRIIAINEQAFYTGQHIFAVPGGHLLEVFRAPVRVIFMRAAQMAFIGIVCPLRGCNAIRSW